MRLAFHPAVQYPAAGAEGTCAIWRWYLVLQSGSQRAAGVESDRLSVANSSNHALCWYAARHQVLGDCLTLHQEAVIWYHRDLQAMASRVSRSGPVTDTDRQLSLARSCVLFSCLIHVSGKGMPHLAPKR
jgi:hypothetical protein